MIYKNSRYTNTPVIIEDANTTFKLRKRIEFNLDNSLIHQFRQGDRLDGLAYQYFQDSQLWWVILEANTQYRTELDIEYGDNLIIPKKDEVMKCLMS